MSHTYMHEATWRIEWNKGRIVTGIWNNVIFDRIVCQMTFYIEKRKQNPNKNVFTDIFCASVVRMHAQWADALYDF